MEKITLNGIACRVKIGVSESERRRPQKILIDAVLEGDFSQAARTDDFKVAVDYWKVEQAIRQEAEGRPCHLIENLAFRLAQIILKQDARIQSAHVTVRKKPVSMPQTREVAASCFAVA